LLSCAATHARLLLTRRWPPALPVVFATRYIDLLWNFSSLYNYVLKLLFIAASAAIVYFIRFGAPQKATYNAEEDTFPVQYLLAPCAVLGVLINQDHSSPFEMVWAFSIYLEAVAILPQLFLLQKQGEVSGAMRQRSRAYLGVGAKREHFTLGPC
jgi:hypothetical protein